MPRPHPLACKDRGRLASPLQLALGDVLLAQEPPLGLGCCGRVTSSRCDRAHGDTSARVTPCDLPWGSPGATKAEACRGGAVSPGRFAGQIENNVILQVTGCFVALKAQPASAVTRHAVLLPAAWKLLLHQL